MGAVGSATLDFGSTPNDSASVVVTGQSSITGTSAVEAWFMGDTTTDHSPDEHMLLANEAHPIVMNVVAGTGFTIKILSPSKWTGQFTVRWVWN